VTSRLPRVRGREVVQALVRGGFYLSHVRGSHHYLRKAGATALVVVPVHGSQVIPLGTLRSILSQAGLSPAEFQELLNL